MAPPLWGAVAGGLRGEVFAEAVVFDDVVHVLVAASGEVDEDAAGLVGRLARQADGVGEGVAAFEGGDDAFDA